MARNIDSWQRDPIIHMLCSKKRLTTPQIAKVAKCSERSITNIRKNMRLFGSAMSPPVSPYRPSSTTKVMVDALCDHLAEKPGLYVEEMAIFLFDEFNVVPSISSIKRAHWSSLWSDFPSPRRANQCHCMGAYWWYQGQRWGADISRKWYVIFRKRIVVICFNDLQVTPSVLPVSKILKIKQRQPDLRKKRLKMHSTITWWQRVCFRSFLLSFLVSINGLGWWLSMKLEMSCCTSHIWYEYPWSSHPMLIFFQIHASTINNDPDRVIRLATDLRFVDSSKPFDKVCWRYESKVLSHWQWVEVEQILWSWRRGVVGFSSWVLYYTTYRLGCRGDHHWHLNARFMEAKISPLQWPNLRGFHIHSPHTYPL